MPTVTAMNHPELNNVELPAADLDATKAFYTAVFGWSWTDYGPTYSAADLPGFEVGLSTAATVAPMPPGGDESGVGPLVLFQGDDLDALAASVEAAGGSIVTQTFGFPGGSRFHFRDPSGNVLGIYRIDPS